MFDPVATAAGSEFVDSMKDVPLALPVIESIRAMHPLFVLGLLGTHAPHQHVLQQTHCESAVDRNIKQQTEPA